MSSSGSRGPGGPPSNRYPDRNEYTEYGKSRRKNFYSPNASRRDYKSGGPGSSSLTQSGPHTAPVPHSTHFAPHTSAPHTSAPHSHSRQKDEPSGSRSYTNPTGIRERNSYGGGGSYSISSKGSSYGSYYPSYGSYNNFSGGNFGTANGTKSGDSASFYGSRSDNWRSDRVKSGDSRLPSSNKPSMTSSYSRPANGASTPADYRIDRYDSYGDAVPSGSLNNISNKWKYNNSSNTPQAIPSSYNANKIPLSANRNSLTGSVGSRYSAKDRIRGSSFAGSSSLSNNGAKRTTGDTYYPNQRSSYSSSGYNSAKTVDRYSTNNQTTNRYPTKQDDHKSRSQSAELEEDNESLTAQDEEKTAQDTNPKLANHFSPKLENHFSPGADYDDNKYEDADNSRLDNEINTTKDISEDDDEEDHDEEDDHDEEEEEDSNNISENWENDSKPVITETKPVPTLIYEKVDVSNEECYADGCIYPKTRLETSFEVLQQEFLEKTKHEDGSNYLKYSLASPITDLNDHSFIYKNYQRYFQSKDQLIRQLKERNTSNIHKRAKLWKEYSHGLELWKQESQKMDQQLRILHPADDEMRREIDSSDSKKQQYVQTPLEPGSPEQPQSAPPGSNRRGRRHGDLVTTEAEFQEILKSLGKELDEDPLIKAQRVSARIPDLILDPVQRNYIKFMDANNIVIDREEWTNRVRTDFANNFSTNEHELFCDAFCLFPKRFGAISRHMGGLRTPSECVVHYYVTKKAVNYKQLLAQHKKKASKKAGRRAKPIRSRNVSQPQTPVSTPSVDTSSMEVGGYTDFKPEVLVPLFPPEPFAEEFFTDTGRRKRAAAPVFEGKPPKKVEPTVGEDNSVDKSTQPLKKKARKRKEEHSSDSVMTSPVANGNIEPEEKLEEIPTTEIAIENGEPPAAEVVFLEPVPEEVVTKLELNEIPAEHDDTKERKKAISSYWSITEANLFPSLLLEHGTKWTTIADKLTTKTATMVRNYYQRNAEKNEWIKVAEEADERLEAKFAAVINTKPDEEEKNPQAMPEEQPDVPIGTFQHTNVVSPSYATKPTISSLLSPSAESTDNQTLSLPGIPATEMHAKSEPVANPEISEPIPTETNSIKETNPKPEMSSFFNSQISSFPNSQVSGFSKIPSSVLPQRASIMSLLNSDSPVKNNLPLIIPHRKKSLHDLLNSPSSEPSAAIERNVKGIISNPTTSNDPATNQ
jgi:hypothetical protein